MRNRNINSKPRGFNQDRPLDEQLISESKRHRPDFSDVLHDRIARAIEMRRDGHASSAAPIETDDVLPLPGQSIPSPLGYALVAAAACAVAVFYITRPVPVEKPIGPAIVAAVVGDERSAVVAVDDDEPTVAPTSPEALAEVIESAADEMSFLASIVSSDRWVDSVIELQLAFDEGLQSLPFGSDLVDE
ncbi:MAG: hypothetical protein WBF93_05910 [Pirellulales bacterium]